MTKDNRFRTIAYALRYFVQESPALMDAVDSVIDADPYPSLAPLAIPHDVLVYAALGNSDVMDFVRNGQRINAIKALRALWPMVNGVGIGLKAAKDAVEDAERRVVWS